MGVQVGQPDFDEMGRSLSRYGENISGLMSGLSGLSASFDQITSSAAQAAAAVGQMGDNGVLSLVGAIAPAGEAIAGMGAAFSQISALGANLTAALNPLAALFSGLWEVISLTAGGAGTLGEAFGAVFGVSLPVVAAVAAIAAALIDLWQTSETFRSAVGQAFAMIQEAVLGAFTKISGAVSGLLGGIQELGAAFYGFYESCGLKSIVELLAVFLAKLTGIAVSGVISTVSTLVSGVIGVFRGLAGVLTGVADVLTGLFTLDPGKLLEGFMKMGEGLGSIFQAIAGTMTELVGGMITRIGEWFSILPEDIAYWLGNALGAVVNWGVQLWDYLGEKIPEIISSIGQWFMELPENIGQAFLGILQKAGEWKESFLAFVREQMPQIVENLLKFFTSLPEKFLEIGENLIKGIWEGIQNAWSGLKSSVGDFCESFVQGFKDALGIASPSKRMAEVGRYSIEGLAAPFAMDSEVFAQIQAFSEGLIETFQQAFSPENFVQMAAAAMEALAQELFKQLAVIQNLFTGSLSAVREMTGQQMLLFGQEMAVNLAAGWYSRWQLVLNQLHLLSSTIQTVFNRIVLFISEKWTEAGDRTRMAWVMINSAVRTQMEALSALILERMSEIRKSMAAVWGEILAVTRGIWEELLSEASYWVSALEHLVASGMGAVNEAWRGGFDAFARIARDACSQVQSAVSGLLDKVRSMCSSILSAVNAAKEAAASLSGVSVAMPSVRGFAAGGFPNTGELFFARENGVPEMVGSIGGRAAVASNGQIVEAIARGVQAGYESAGLWQGDLLREQNGLLREILYKDASMVLDGRELLRQIESRKARNGYMLVT